MKNLKFAEALNSEVENIVENTKVSAAFVQELKEAFLMFPVRTDMRFKQSSKGELIISVTVVYATATDFYTDTILCNVNTIYEYFFSREKATLYYYILYQ